MRAFSPSFSPFTHTTAAGNGIANPSTLHASWQLVISRPVLRQHTPRYVSHPYRVVVLVAPPSTQEYPLDLAFLPLPPCTHSLSHLPTFSSYIFPSFSLTILRIRFSLSPFTSLHRFPPSRYPSFPISHFPRATLFVVSFLALTSVLRHFYSSPFSRLLHFPFFFISIQCSRSITRQDLRTRINYFRIFGARAMRGRGMKRTGCSPDPAHPRSHKWSFVMTSETSARVEFLESQADCTRTLSALSVELALDDAKLRIL